jgi:ubiquinone/menaquinone biosynthesis C-methylase UbiE
MEEHASKNKQTYDAGAKGWQAYAPENLRHKYLEKPAMERELPDSLTGKRVLCVGVGSGEELRMLLARSPKKIVAIDISGNLLALAQERFPEVEFQVMDMMALSFPPESFDMVYSSLAFHYAHDWDTLLLGIRNVLTPKGALLFSTHHPGYWAKHPTGASHTNIRGVKLTQHTATLPGGVGITYYNHPNTDSILEALTHAGFSVNHAYAPSVVPVPLDTLTPILRKKYKNLAKTNEETPVFFVVGAMKG